MVAIHLYLATETERGIMDRTFNEDEVREVLHEMTETVLDALDEFKTRYDNYVTPYSYNQKYQEHLLKLSALLGIDMDIPKRAKVGVWENKATH